MSIIEIHDEESLRRLQQIAEREQRSVDDVLKTMIDRYLVESPAVEKRDPSEGVRRVRQKAYAKARRYWESVGDSAKASLTDEELDEQFGVFDEEGIPRLKSELESLEPPPGSGAFAAKIAGQSGLRSGRPDLARRSRQILDEHFADDYLKQMKGEDADG